MTASSKITPGWDARAHFPIFKSVNGSHLAYLDSGASSQKPSEVSEALSHILLQQYANVHRGAYKLSADTTLMLEEARAKVQKLIDAPELESIIFVRGTTEGVNLVAYGIETLMAAGDTILLTLLEHHSNIVPWQMLAARKGLKIVFTEISEHGELNLEDYKAKLKAHRPKLVAFTQLANSLGTVTPAKEMVKLAKEVGAWTLIDGAQGICHLPTSVREIGCDFYVFSAHKLYGPTGIGALFGRTELLERMSPFQGGGDMISYVSTEGFSCAALPSKFEAGTPAITEAVAFGTAIDFFKRIDPAELRAHESELFNKAYGMLKAEAGVTVYGPRNSGGEQVSIVSFNVDGVHAHDLATVADTFDVQFRAGHHCAMPTLKRLGLPSTARISLGVYSVSEDLDRLMEAIRQARKMFT